MVTPCSPSEFAKPAFVLLSAWLFAEADRRPDMPATGAAVALFLLFAVLLVLEPDLGQTLLVSLVWCALFFLANRPLKWFAVLVAALSAALVAAYFTFGHVRWRIDRFLHPALGDSFQTERALRSFGEGGLFGKGPEKARSRSPYRTRIPTSFSPSSPKNTAYSLAW